MQLYTIPTNKRRERVFLYLRDEDRGERRIVREPHVLRNEAPIKEKETNKAASKLKREDDKADKERNTESGTDRARNPEAERIRDKVRKGVHNGREYT